MYKQDFNQFQYNLALSIVDTAFSDIYRKLESKGVLDNTYIIFASDNGGCIKCGGRNGPLRGSKGTLFEGLHPFFITIQHVAVWLYRV